MTLTFFALVFGTFISEDLACVTAGLLIQRGDLSASTGILACTLGIFIGDVGLWGAGRIFGRAALGWPRIARWVDQERCHNLRGWLERHVAGAIIGSRFLPGTRLPLYLIAGLLEVQAAVFLWWALLGSVLWTPLVVLLSAGLGDAFITYTSPADGWGWIPRLATALVLLLSLHVWKSDVGPLLTRRVLTARRDAARRTRWPLDAQDSGSG